MKKTCFIKGLLGLTLLLSILVSGRIAPAGAAELTIHQVKNSQYFIPDWGNPGQGEWVQLQDGEYHRENAANPLAVKIVALALGYLSDHKTKDAAVVYGFSLGGTGFFMMLCAVINDRGELKKTNLVDLEDRARINSLGIKSGKIILDWMAHRGIDPAPFPTWRKVDQYTLVGHNLVKLGPKTK